jgi:hypothetical protein
LAQRAHLALAGGAGEFASDEVTGERRRRFAGAGGELLELLGRGSDNVT